jgi:uncharacterized protein
MGRVLVLILLVVLVVWLIRRAFRSPASPDRADAPRGAPPVEGDLVACARCGVNLPRSEARALGDALYCSEEHARLGKP